MEAVANCVAWVLGVARGVGGPWGRRGWGCPAPGPGGSGGLCELGVAHQVGGCGGELEFSVDFGQSTHAESAQSAAVFEVGIDRFDQASSSLVGTASGWIGELLPCCIQRCPATPELGCSGWSRRRVAQVLG